MSTSPMNLEELITSAKKQEIRQKTNLYKHIGNSCVRGFYVDRYIYRTYRGF